jgi:hypothetical protein
MFVLIDCCIAMFVTCVIKYLLIETFDAFSYATTLYKGRQPAGYAIAKLGINNNSDVWEETLHKYK